MYIYLGNTLVTILVLIFFRRFSGEYLFPHGSNWQHFVVTASNNGQYQVYHNGIRGALPFGMFYMIFECSLNRYSEE